MGSGDQSSPSASSTETAPATPSSSNVDSVINQLESLKKSFKDYGIDSSLTQVELSRKTFPLMSDIGSRMFMSTSAGFGFGMVFFKSWTVRRFTTMFGLGLGLGLNYSQVRCLWHATRGTLDSSSARNQEALQKELTDIHLEMKLRSKLKLN